MTFFYSISKRLIELVDSFIEENNFFILICDFFFLNDKKIHLSGLAGIESANEVVTCNVYQLIINFNITKRHVHEVVTCIVAQWIIEHAEGNDVKAMTVCISFKANNE